MHLPGQGGDGDGVDGGQQGTEQQGGAQAHPGNGRVGDQAHHEHRQQDEADGEPGDLTGNPAQLANRDVERGGVEQRGQYQCPDELWVRFDRAHTWDQADADPEHDEQHGRGKAHPLGERADCDGNEHETEDEHCRAGPMHVSG